MHCQAANAEVLPARILIVDDAELNRKLLTAVVKAEGYEWVLASGGQEALDILHSSQFDVVLLDLMMPGVSGLEVLSELGRRGLLPQLPVVVITALTDAESRLAALRAGAADFLNKPTDRNELACRLRNLTSLKRMRDNLEQEVARRTQELRESNLETVQRLTQAAEYRDDDTGTHLLRIGEYSALLGRDLGLPESEVELLRHASTMHDVGKIGISDTILLKPGKLTPEEFAIMKTHTIIGARILSGGRSRLIRAAEEIARSHHERWDGSGYPDGLKAEAIPHWARLVAVCDVFDALTSARPYKQAWPVEQAVAELVRCRGAHFDAELVDRFVARLPEALAILAAHRAE